MMPASFTLLDLLRSKTTVDCDTLDSEGNPTPDGCSSLLIILIANDEVPLVFGKQLADCTSNQVRSSSLACKGRRESADAL